MKIGILTFHRAQNFGAALQAFALYSYLTEKGHQCEIIDYRNRCIERTYDILNPRILWSRKNILLSLRKYIARLTRYANLKEKQTIYKNFRRKYLHLSPKVNSLQNCDYDAIIVGSDQVWRLDLTGGLDNIYVLDTAPTDVRKISYAASTDISDIEALEKDCAMIAPFLKDFKAISVRENIFKINLSKFVSQPISECVDPTFLHSADFYRKIQLKPRVKHYMLVYHLFESDTASAIATKIAGERNLKVIEVHASPYYHTKSPQNIHLSSFGPCEMLGLIDGAELVITTSFHGLALSMIFQKEFIVISKGANERLINLLDLANLSYRMIQEGTEQFDYESWPKIGYPIAELDNRVIASKKFINTALQ